jgi:pyruvate dehydrogenase E1 component alpha subunit
MTAIWNLPVIFVCENNLYGASTHVSRVMKITDIAQRADAYGIPGVVVDGNDAIAVYEVVQEAVARARAGKGPTLVECKTYRRCGHSRGDGNLYRDKDEEKEWFAKDPLPRMKAKLIDMGLLTDEEAEKMKAAIEAEIDAAITYAQESPPPKPEDTLKDVFV